MLPELVAPLGKDLPACSRNGRLRVRFGRTHGRAESGTGARAGRAGGEVLGGGAVAAPMPVAPRPAPGPVVPLLFAVRTGAAVSTPFAVPVKLGRDYLPTRPGTAAGVTLGLGVSLGGPVAPALGALADLYGLRCLLGCCARRRPRRRRWAWPWRSPTRWPLADRQQPWPGHPAEGSGHGRLGADVGARGARPPWRVVSCTARGFVRQNIDSCKMSA